MPGKDYTLFTGRVLDRRIEADSRSPHFQILLSGGGDLFRVAVNTRSGTSHHRRADLLYFADDDFRHPLTRQLAEVADGPKSVPTYPGGLALDYQRGGLFDRRHMRRIPSRKPGPRNDLMDELDYRTQRAMANPAALLHAYGTRWGPEPRQPDHIFHFSPGNGIHDVHMNQGNWDEHWHDNAAWSDGGLIFAEPDRDRWCAIFLAFQTQSWQTDSDGNPLPSHDVLDEVVPLPESEVRHPARIIGAFVHPDENRDGVEHVTVRNQGHLPLDVSGWRIQNRDHADVILEGSIPPRRGRRFQLPGTVPLSKRGGIIRLLDARGDEVDGVSYTGHEARRKHGNLTF